MIQIYCRRPTLGETDALITMGSDLIGWHVRPEDGNALIQSRQLTELIATRQARSSVLVHSSKIEVLRRVAEMLNPDFLLMSSDRNDKEMKLLAEMVGPRTKLMMSVPVRPAGSSMDIDSLGLAVEYSRYAGCLIVDTCPNPLALTQFGCTGRTNDWDICSRIVTSVNIPVILAGGLNPENVRASIKAVRPHGVDACTSLEFADRSKNLERCRAFIAAVRAGL